MSDMAFAIRQIQFARSYTNRLLDAFDPDKWFQQPQEGIGHVAWQVGHLAMAQYRLALERLRGRQPEDEALISESFLRLFAAGSIPSADASQYPSPAEIRAVFQRVHEKTLEDLQNYSQQDLHSPPTKPHKLAATKLESLLWCAHHEMLHAGQIGLLRRLCGEAPIW